MKDFYDMCEKYLAVLRTLEELRSAVSLEMKEEHDPDRLRLLEQRKALLETEKYEVASDLKAIRAYIRERENAKKKNIS